MALETSAAAAVFRPPSPWYVRILLAALSPSSFSRKQNDLTFFVVLFAQSIGNKSVTLKVLGEVPEFPSVIKA